MTTIICINDDPKHGENITKILTEAGYEVLVSGDGDEGLEMILQHLPGLILYNISKPSDNRYRILKEVREKYPLLAEIPFIFISCATNNQQILSDLNSGADNFLIAPVNTSLLLATIQASLRQVDRIKFKHEKLLVLDI